MSSNCYSANVDRLIDQMDLRSYGSVSRTRGGLSRTNGTDGKLERMIDFAYVS